MNLFRYKTPDGIAAFTTGRDCCVEMLGLKTEALALPRQTHSDHVLWMHEAGRPEDTDAVITDVPGLCVCVKTADCIPVLLYDRKCRVVAAAHAGWRGTVSRIVSKTIAKMGVPPSELSAIIGPGISQEAFEVGDEVYERFREAGFPIERIAVRKVKWHLDLWQANRWLLEEAGVLDIHVAGMCTYKDSARFYSARREGIETGRNMNGIMLIP
ncbi:MAG: peptidoglycan editing factor PgeF [Bacteroidaceae bacterium]|nr:peptidoglycan editing factor PgeF [Bacteroidaceae bacterium]